MSGELQEFALEGLRWTHARAGVAGTESTILFGVVNGLHDPGLIMV